MSGTQVNAKATRFLRDHQLGSFVFLVDAGDKVIDEYGIRNTQIEEAIEKDVPYPTTYILDRDGVIRFKDTRRDFRTWLSQDVLKQALTGIQPTASR
jgi:peroxiredoxin